MQVLSSQRGRILTIQHPPSQKFPRPSLTVVLSLSPPPFSLPSFLSRPSILHAGVILAATKSLTGNCTQGNKFSGLDIKLNELGCWRDSYTSSAARKYMHLDANLNDLN